MRLSLLDDGQFILKDGSTIFIENVSENVVFISVDVNGYRKILTNGDTIYSPSN